MSASFPSGYGLPSSEAERDRLRLQAQRQEANTEAFLVDAGIGEGYSVLDVGTGLGDVALIAARLVGRFGSVVGIDRDAAQIEHARRRASEQGLGNVEFEVADLHALSARNQAFDAAVGRFVLMRQPEPVSALKAVAERVRPGGVIAFWEASHPLHLADSEESWFSWPPHPAINRLRQIQYRALEAVGVQPLMGHRLASCFAGAGLPMPQVGSPVLATVGRQAAAPLFQFARSLVARATEPGHYLAGEVDIDALEREIDAWPQAEQLVVSPLAPVVTAWVLKP